MNILVMTDLDGCIGVDNDQPIRLKNDLARFKKFTQNKVVICGSTTVKTFPNNYPLKNRSTIILSTRMTSEDFIDCPDRNIHVYNSIDKVYALPNYVNSQDIWVIGGASIYRQLIRFVDNIFLTKVNTRFTGDNKVFLATDYLYNFTEDNRTFVSDEDLNTGAHYNTELIHYRRMV